MILIGAAFDKPNLEESGKREIRGQLFDLLGGHRSTVSPS
jgi:hypothetical protein